MRRVAVVGSFVVVALALGAAMAPVASAFLPEFGRCIKVAAGTRGAYGNAGCTGAANSAP